MAAAVESTGKRRVSGLLTLAAVATVALVVAAAGFVLQGIDSVRFIDWYRVDQPSELTVAVTTGSSGWWRVTAVQETATSITITVRSLEFQFGPQSGVGHTRELAVHLAQPLGDRVVLDGLGYQVRRQTSG